MDQSLIVTINTGSSSLKAGVYQAGNEIRRQFAFEIERIGQPGSQVGVAAGDDHHETASRHDVPDHAAALAVLREWMQTEGLAPRIGAIGHRVVHGGPSYAAPQAITGEVMAILRQLVPIDPKHLPQAIAAIESLATMFPTIPQIACFDTAFHSQKPPVARIYPLPRNLGDEGVLRYGFHGLSYESIMTQLRALPNDQARGRIVIAHLGNGASMVAVHEGHPLDTTMGFTPTGGLMMGTRCGDLDPGVLLYLLQVRGMRPEAVNDLVNQEAGLLGVSGQSSDMCDLLAREAVDPRAADAVALFCYQAKKYLGALIAVLGGLDTLVFTGGIGEHAAPIRERICQGMEFCGIRLDLPQNQQHAPIISGDDAPVVVRVMQTDEDLMIAHHTQRLWHEQGAPDGLRL